MPIAADKSNVVVQVDLPVNVAAPEYKGVTVDTYKTLLSKMLVYVEGSSMITEYYSQVLGADSELNPSEPDLPTPYQQYIKVKEFEIKVTDPLSHSQDPETNEFTIVGGGTIYAGVIPNVGDMFLADIGDGREGVFTITLSDKKTLFTSSVYSIEYRMTGVNADEVRGNLEDKVVKVTYFRKDFVTTGQNPIIIEETVLSLEKITSALEDIKQYYFSKFFSNEFSTLILPNQPDTVYDSFLVKSISDLFNVGDHPVISKIRYLNVEGNDALKQDTLWTALLNLDKRYLSNAVKNMWTISTNYWSSYPVLKTIRFSGISNIMYPTVPLTTVDAQYVGGEAIVGVYITDSARYDVTGELIPWVDPDPLPPVVDGDPYIPVIPLIRPVTIDNFYVFSEAFYNESEEGQSVLEVQTNNLLNNRTIDLAQLYRICEEYKTWSLLDQFYYLPVMIIILKVVLRKL